MVPSAFATKETRIDIDILKSKISPLHRRVIHFNTHSYTLAYIALFEAKLRPRYCRIEAPVPPMNMSNNDPPKAVVQMIDAQTNAKIHLIQIG